MTRFTDGAKTIEIEMYVSQEGYPRPDFSVDFFNVSALRYDDEKDAFVVPDVAYLEEQARDWKAGAGDYADEYAGRPGHTPDDRIVEVNHI